MPAKYGDLGKAASDLFSKNYEHGKYSLEVKSKSDGFEFTTKGHQNNATGAISASHESKINLGKLGTLKETFTPGKSAVAMDLENSKVLANAKINALFNVSLDGCPIPNFEKVKLNYNVAQANICLDSNLKSGLNFDAVLDIPKVPVNVGVKASLDLSSMALRSKELAIAKKCGSVDYVFKTSLNSDAAVSLHNVINSDLAVATSITHNSNGTSVGIAAAQKGSCNSVNQFKIDNSGRFGISHITPLRIGAKLTLSGEFDAFNLNSGSHKLGAGLKFDF